mmetsp:Transcript_3692/g.7829  ORF Transcript_3692/g.7829 Transcript_3692/m.7829 type:complete len:204 (+) Transcript_3692:3050-3661(+)
MCSASCKQAEKVSTLPHNTPSLSPKIISPGFTVTPAHCTELTSTPSPTCCTVPAYGVILVEYAKHSNSATSRMGPSTTIPLTPLLVASVVNRLPATALVDPPVLTTRTSPAESSVNAERTARKSFGRGNCTVLATPIMTPPDCFGACRNFITSVSIKFSPLYFFKSGSSLVDEVSLWPLSASQSGPVPNFCSRLMMSLTSPFC